ncbi:MAG: M28 family peptidase [Pseudobdellovibrionaceae bacterium]|nr:M28 family peptidase [Bdellovibrionales bacterium]USN48402.1 MAG: M28 family peptidase [Pseudobdellovibrionaceae bacterium]
MRNRLAVFIGVIVFTSWAHSLENAGPREAIVADLSMLEKVGVAPKAVSNELGLGMALATSDQQKMISQVAHADGRCGGYEKLFLSRQQKMQGMAMSSPSLFASLIDHNQKNKAYEKRFRLFNSSVTLDYSADVAEAVSQVDFTKIKETVEWLSSFETRYHLSSTPNRHIDPFVQRLNQMVQGLDFNVDVERISHSSTRQDSIRVRIPGLQRSQEIIVLGGHLDSINQSWGDLAPGADDNASGSADLVEALRVILAHGPLDRTIEFFWYAGEETGLVGSGEIAREYNATNKDVVAVLQLDMTMVAGEGRFTMSSMTDYTSSWLREYFGELNRHYIKARVLEGRCGYGCSDHVSWYRQGYPTLLPFEASLQTFNRKIHSVRDIVDSDSDFQHAAMFAKIAVALGLQLGNSTDRQPY